MPNRKKSSLKAAISAVRLAESARTPSFKSAQSKDPAPTPNPNLPAPTQSSPRGSSGTKVFSGFFSEEYLPELRGTRAAEIYDQMRRSDAQVQMETSAVINPILAETWEIEAGTEGPQYEKHRNFIDHILFHDLDKPWKDKTREGLSFVFHGYSLFEITHKVVLNHPKWGTYNGIETLGFRSQRTVYRWNLDPKTGAIVSVTQLAQGDLGRYLEIPGEFLVHFALGREGDNYEGISPLRSCYGAWLRKNSYLKYMAIGMQKSAVPTPVATVPVGMQDTAEYDKLLEVLENYSSGESEWITKPTGWDIELNTNQFDPAKCIVSVEFEDKQMSRAFLAVFLELGQTGSGGNRALGENQNDFFDNSVEHVADAWAAPWNEQIIPQLIRMNFGPQDYYPRLKHTGAKDALGKEKADILRYLAETQYITPDNPLEVSIRKQLKLPAMSLDGQRKVQAPKQQTGEDLVPTGPGAIPKAAPAQFSHVQFAEKPRAVKLIEAGKVEVAKVMRANLKRVGDRLVQDLMRAVRAATPAEKARARQGVEPTGGVAYKAELSKVLASLATQALLKARSEVPKARNVKLHDAVPLSKTVQLDDMGKLPKRVQDKIKTKVDNEVDGQLGYLGKKVNTTYDHTEGTTDSDSLLESDLADTVDGIVEARGIDVAASDMAALITNESRNAFFFEPSVVEQIASFTFTADPSGACPLCTDLDGKTFLADDPGAWEYFPPLHENCACIWEPNPIGGDDPDITGLEPSSASLNKHMTLSDRVRRPRVVLGKNEIFGKKKPPSLDA